MMWVFGAERRRVVYLCVDLGRRVRRVWRRVCSVFSGVEEEEEENRVRGRELWT